MQVLRAQDVSQRGLRIILMVMMIMIMMMVIMIMMILMINMMILMINMMMMMMMMMTCAKRRVDEWQSSTFATLTVAFETLFNSLINDDHYNTNVEVIVVVASFMTWSHFDKLYWTLELNF